MTGTRPPPPARSSSRAAWRTSPTTPRRPTTSPTATVRRCCSSPAAATTSCRRLCSARTTRRTSSTRRPSPRTRSSTAATTTPAASPAGRPSPTSPSTGRSRRSPAFSTESGCGKGLQGNDHEHHRRLPAAPAAGGRRRATVRRARRFQPRIDAADRGRRRPDHRLLQRRDPGLRRPPQCLLGRRGRSELPGGDAQGTAARGHRHRRAGRRQADRPSGPEAHRDEHPADRRKADPGRVLGGHPGVRPRGRRADRRGRYGQRRHVGPRPPAGLRVHHPGRLGFRSATASARPSARCWRLRTGGTCCSSETGPSS